MTADWLEQVQRATPARITGRVSEIAGAAIAVADFPVPVGSVVRLEREIGGSLEGEVIGLSGRHAIVYPLGSARGIRRGNRVSMVRSSPTIPIGEAQLGRVLNAQGRCIDGRPQPALAEWVSIDQPAPDACGRPRIQEPIATGVRAIDGLLSCGQGQRLGIFAGSGVGKSVLLGMMSRYTNADINVVALIGERGREVNDFIEKDLGDGLRKTVVVVATSDEPAVVRTRAVLVATTIAEYFRDRGQDVLLMVDSLTRLAMAQREIGLAAGEPPTSRGYPPSVYSLLPRIVERAGRTERGSITAFYSVLVEGDDTNEPIADAVRGLLDGHCWLSRELAEKGHFPAIDVLGSISRLMTEVTSDEHRDAARTVRQLLAAYREHEDLISIGAYRVGSNPVVDTAIEMRPAINAFLCQAIEEPSSLDQTVRQLTQLGAVGRSKLATRPITGGVPVNAMTSSPS